MAVYVDDMAAPFTPTHVKHRTYVMCHMIADSREELDAMADRLGVARKWIQNEGHDSEHYDIAKSKRALAVTLGAIELTSRDLVSRMRAKRAAPQP